MSGLRGYTTTYSMPSCCHPACTSHDSQPHARAGNDFFRVAHGVSFANTGSFDKTRTAKNASAAAGMPDSAQGSA